MYRFSAQTSPISSLPTLLGSSCTQQQGKSLQSYPPTNPFQHLQKHSWPVTTCRFSQKQCVVPCPQTSCLTLGGCPTPPAGGCLTPPGSYRTPAGCPTPPAGGCLTYPGGYGTPPGCPTPPAGGCLTPPSGYRIPPIGGAPAFSVEDLHVGIVGCDPSREPLKSQILTNLGLPPHAIVERLAGNCGGLNEGTWTVQDHSNCKSLILKLVKCRRAYGMPSEADRFARLYQEHPSIANDPMVAFPIKVFKCFGQAGDNSHDLIVMRKANGQPLGDIIARKRSCGEMRDIMQILRQLGMFLARFHRSYNNKQHGDFQPSNIFYDVSSGTFAMIDIADLGNPSSAEGDIAHFSQSLKILSNSYGPQFFTDGKRNFEEGYRGMP